MRTESPFPLVVFRLTMSSSEIISAGDIVKIVRQDYSTFRKCDIVDFSINPFSDNVDGFNSEHFLLEVNTKTNGKQTFFVKYFPSRFQFQKRFAEDAGTFSKEITVYEEVFRKFGKVAGFDSSFAPKYYFGRDKNLVVFENLSEKGFAVTKQPNLNELDLIHVKLPLEALAKLHAGSIAYEETKSREMNTKYRLSDDYDVHLKEPLFRKDETFLGYRWCQTSLECLISLIDVFPQEKLLKDEFRKGLIKLFEESLETMEPNPNMRNVLCHGDMWGKNVLYRYENGNPVECKLVDFQLIRYMVPAHDVLQWIYIACSPEMRKYHLDHLLEFYYSCLKKELENMNFVAEDVFPRYEFVKGAEYIFPQIKLLNAFQYTTQGGTQEFYNKVFRDDGEYTKFLYVDRTGFAMEQFVHDSNYNRLLTWALSELCDFIKEKYINAATNTY